MYIRTKDGRIVDTTKYPEHPASWSVQASDYALTVNQSENLEELCDEFVFVNKVGNFDKSYVIHYNMPNHIFTEPTVKEKIAYIKKYYKDELDKIRGAIYTDEGLIYVAKMKKRMRDITDIREVDKICKQPNANHKDKEICFDCPLFLGFGCYANIIYMLDLDVEVKD